jgi:hypothetical protein
MPWVMLKKNWPANFRRTITTGKRSKEVNFDEKARPRVITDEVVPEETEPANELKPAN